VQKIILVEDDDDIREIILYALRGAGFDAHGFESSQGVFNLPTPNLYILDIMLPGEDGLSILKKIRQNSSVPVMMLTAKGSEHDKVKGLDLGADDYVTKPFGVMELISRIKALLRRSGAGSASKELSYKNIRVDHERRVVLVSDQPVTLTFKEYELLHHLMVNQGIALGRDRIIETVWGYDFEGESRTVDMHIKSLRQKLREGGEHIKTIRNVGYKLGE